MNAAATSEKAKILYGRIFLIALCILPALSMLAPRFLGYAPAALGILGWLAYRPVFGRWPAPAPAAFLWMAAMCTLMSLSMFWSVDPAISLNRVLNVVPILTGGVMLFSLARSNIMPHADFQRMFVYAVLLAALLCAVELYTQGVFYHLLRPDYTKPFNSSGLNRSVVVLVICFFLALPGIKKDVWGAGLVLVTLAVLYKTQSQSAQFAFMLGAALYLLFPYRKKAAWILLAGILAAGILTAPWVAQVMFHHLAENAGHLEFFRNSYAANRMEIWDFVSRRALERPLLGHGVEAAKAMNDFDTARLYHPSYTILHPHNFVIQLWIEFGAAGAVLAAAFFAAILRSLYRFGPDAARIGVPVLFCCISAAVTSYGLWQSWWLGTFIMAAAVCAVHIRKTNPE